MKPALLPTIALGAAMSAFFLPPVLALTGAAPARARPVPMLVVQADDGPALARHREPAAPAALPVKAGPADPKSIVPQFTRVASR
jgi:hypothetical protein